MTAVDSITIVVDKLTIMINTKFDYVLLIKPPADPIKLSIDELYETLNRARESKQ